MKGKMYTTARSQGDVLNTVSVSTSIKQTSDKLELTARSVYSQKDIKIRYIRDWINGSSGNTSNHWVQITAIKNDVNLALNKPVTGSSVANTSWPYTNITNGNFSTGSYGQSNIVGLQWVQIDLESVVTDIEYIQVFHYYGDGRTYNNSKTEVSADGVTWFPIYDSLIGGTYPESAEGRRYYVNDGSFLNRAESKITQTSNKIDLVVSDTDTIKGDALVSAINLQPGNIQIQAKNVNIKGAVSFNTFDEATQSILSSGNSQLLNQNYDFGIWPNGSAYPTSYAAQTGAAPTRVVSDNGTGYYAQSMISTGVNTYFAQTIAGQPYTEYATVEFTFRLTAGAIGGAGVLFRLNSTTGILKDHPIPITDYVSTPTLNKWYTITKVVKSDTSVNFKDYTFFVMPGWTSLGAINAKTIQFHSAKVRPSTVNEIEDFKTGTTVNGWVSTTNTTLIDGGKIQTNTIDVNALKAGTIDATKITVTNMSANNITTGTLNASAVTVTNLNASNITTGTLSANRISANSIVANKLALGAVNIVNDPSVDAIGTAPFDATTILVNNGWNKGSSVPTFVDDATYGRVLKITNVGGANSTVQTNSFFVDPTKTYKITFRFKYSKSDGTAPTGSMYLGFNGYTMQAQTTEVANAGSYEYISDGYSTSGTNPYFFITPKGSASGNAWQMVETYLYPSEFYGDRSKLKNVILPEYGASRKVWFMSAKTNIIKLRMLNYNQSTPYGDGVSNNDLFVSALQVTEVDGGSLTASNITTGVLNANNVTISASNAGVTIDGNGVKATNATTGVNVTMNSTTGFEIKKGTDTVFTVNTDGTLNAKNMSITGTYSVNDANAPQGYTEFTPGGLMVSSLNAGATTSSYTYNYKNSFYRLGSIVTKEIGGIGTEENAFNLNGMFHESVKGTTLIQNQLSVSDTGMDLFSTEPLNVTGGSKTTISGNIVELKGKNSVSGSIPAVKVYGTGLYSVENISNFGKVAISSAVSMASVNEVQIDMIPNDGTDAGMRLFSRTNGMGLYDRKGGYTFLRYTPSTGTAKKELLVASENLNLYANNIFNLTVADSDGTSVSVINADGSKEPGGVWLDIGGGSRTHIYAGEKNINPDVDFGFSSASESLILEANTNIYLNWGTQSGYSENQGIVATGGIVRPATDNVVSFGTTSYRWKQIFAGIGTINTSDSRSKENMVQINNSNVTNPKFEYKEASTSFANDIYETMKEMPLFTFKYKSSEEKDMGSKQIGFMADLILDNDAKGVAKHFAYRTENEEEMAGVSTQSYAATIHVALQEEMKRNDALEKKVEDLEKRLERLEQLLGGQS